MVLIAANGLSAGAQGQFMFVLPWMLLARDHSPRAAAFGVAFVYLPLLLFAIPAGRAGDRADPLRLSRIAVLVTLVGAALYPAVAVVGYDYFWLVLVAAVISGTARNFGEAGLMRSMADTGSKSMLLRAHALRTTVNQAAVFGSPFIGLLLFRSGGAEAVMAGICVLQLLALGLLGRIPPIERSVPDGRPPTLAEGFASLRANRRLRRIAGANVAWSISAGAALGVMPGVLREHLNLNEVSASITFLSGAALVTVLTLPIVRGSQRRIGGISTFLVATAVQGLSVILLAHVGFAIIAPVLYPLFLLANSAAATALNGARALEVEQSHQALLNISLTAVGLVGFGIGLIAAAGLLGAIGFGALLLLIGLGMGATALGFRRTFA